MDVLQQASTALVLPAPPARDVRASSLPAVRRELNELEYLNWCFGQPYTGIVDASVLTVYTVEGSLHMHLLANEPGEADTRVRDEGDRAVQRLLAALAR
jgi:hypothetical protein